MNGKADEREPDAADGMADAVRKRQEREQRWRTEGNNPSSGSSARLAFSAG